MNGRNNTTNLFICEKELCVQGRNKSQNKDFRPKIYSPHSTKEQHISDTCITWEIMKDMCTTIDWRYLLNNNRKTSDYNTNNSVYIKVTILSKVMKQAVFDYNFYVCVPDTTFAALPLF